MLFPGNNTLILNEASLMLIIEEKLKASIAQDPDSGQPDIKVTHVYYKNNTFEIGITTTPTS